MKNTETKNRPAMIRFSEDADEKDVYAAVNSVLEAAFAWALAQKNSGFEEFEVKSEIFNSVRRFS